MSKDNSNWYASGLKFQCTSCGNCCTGPPGYVWFSFEEGIQMSDDLGVSHSLFLRKYARKFGEKWSLGEKKSPYGYDCVFLDRESVPNKAICRIYKTRPAQCRTWPFWKENLSSEEDWNRAAQDTPCPGMGRGKLVSIEEIRIQRDKTPD